MDIRVRVDQARQKLTVRVIGELDLATSGDLAEVISSFHRIPIRTVVLDLADVSFCDCAGLNAIIATNHAITDAGAVPVLQSISRPMRRIITLTGCNWLTNPHMMSRARCGPYTASARQRDRTRSESAALVTAGRPWTQRMT